MTDTTTNVDVDVFDYADSSAIMARYESADGGTKRRMHAAARSAMDAAVRDGDFDAATRIMATRESMTTVRETATVDYAQRVADHAATLRAALTAIESGDYTLPDGVDIPADVDLSTGTPDADRVRALVTITGRKAHRGAVVDYIAATLVGTMTAAELRNAWTASDDYPTAPPSAGAIGAAWNRVNGGDTDATFTTDTNATGVRVFIA